MIILCELDSLYVYREHKDVVCIESVHHRFIHCLSISYYTITSYRLAAAMVAMNEVMYEVMHDYVRIIHRYAMSVKDQLEMQHIDGE